jgi:serine protease Do
MENMPHGEDQVSEIKNASINVHETKVTDDIDNIIETNQTTEDNINNESNENITINEINHTNYTADAGFSPIVENYLSRTPISTDLNPLSNNISEEYIEKNKRKTFPKVFSYIAVGVICSLLGGVGTGAVLLYSNPRFSNPLTSTGSTAQNKSTNKTAPSYLVSTSTTNLSVAEIAKRVGPAVVGVSTKSGGSSPFSQKTEEGMGSGIIINKDGYILTNYHVISGAEQVKVILSNGKEVSAKVVNYDSASDVAVIRITDQMEMPAIAELGDSDALEVGEPAIAIGNPLGKELLGSVTVGVISALNREIAVSDKTLAYIQTDAAINPGNSGGALVNSKGQVVGINTAKIGGSGVEGLGFALPINAIKPKIQALSQPILKLGIAGEDVTPEISKRSNFPVGFYIEQVQQFSPAEKAGIKIDDIIVNFDGQKVTGVNDINTIKGKHKAGDVVKLEVIRNKQSKILTITLAE